MTRIPRLHLILVLAAILVLGSVPLASARPLATSQMVERTVDGWIGAAVRWLEDLVGLGRSTADRTAGSLASHQKGGGTTPTGGSCLDPTGKPWCL